MFEIDHKQRCDLGQLHALAGGAPARAPAAFLDSDAGLRAYSELGVAAAPPGTWHPLPIALAYAGWLDPALAARLAQATSQRIASLLPEFAAARALAVQCGLDGNQAILSAARAVQRTSGIDPVALLGVVGLRSDDVHFSATELGRHLGQTAREVNQRLAELGLQQRVGATWSPTHEGRQHAVVLDVGKQHGDGAPVTQLRWRVSVLGLLRPNDLLATDNERKTGT
ncbi:hypothetical protein [Luteimonas sp. MHLX1A]|mgnify:CR=1 FL=1|uniref:hypothetical protein n=1 Tax=Alterluteimonas muca TaxID=2878684 RepID=UPI001E61D505|nr:hypothetical protein [Luteimonas sp. MHLX1A]MCD9046879.1 hypothetical protein [Luteimonas sp. MHLX1A]